MNEHTAYTVINSVTIITCLSTAMLQVDTNTDTACMQR